MSHFRRCGRRSKTVVAAVSALTVGAILPWNALAGTTLAPFATADASYTALANQSTYASVGAISFYSTFSSQTFISSGVLISPEWVLTAGHVVEDPETQTFDIGSTAWNNGTAINDNQHFENPGYDDTITSGTDIGLLHLSTPVTTIAPTSRYFGSSELGHTATSIGFGITGDGITGGQFSGTGTLAPGVKRAVQNSINYQGADFNQFVQGPSFSNNIMGSLFTSSPSTNTDVFPNVPDLGGASTPGDSGGGVFITVNGRNYVAGVTSFILTSNQSDPGVYGDVYAWTRVSAFDSWIDDNTANYWNSATSGTFGGSAANWSMGPTPTHAVPTATSIVGFNQSGSYTVTFGGATSNYQLLSRAGNVTLNLGGLTYNLTSTAYDGSAVVGRYSGENASITLRNGNMVSNDALLGQLAGANGTVTIGAGANWTVNGNLYVGGSYDGAGGNGTVSIQNSGKALNVNGILTLRSGGKVLVAGGGNKVVRAQGISIDSGGKIDLADNDMVIDYSGASPLTTIKSQIVTGRNGGNWAGNGITSSTAQAQPNTTALGYGEASTLGLGSASFDGVPLDSTSVIVKYTYLGDANLDGKVDISDLILLANHWNQSSQLWTGGDFNYDGVVNVADLSLLARDWQDGVSSPLAPSLSALMTSLGLSTDFSVTTVPEPTIPGGILIAGLALMNRRRRSR